jgi:hypothetical protein
MIVYRIFIKQTITQIGDIYYCANCVVGLVWLVNCLMDFLHGVGLLDRIGSKVLRLWKAQ